MTIDQDQAKSVRECVKTMIPHVIKARPEMSREQQIAVAFSKCRKRHDVSAEDFDEIMLELVFDADSGVFITALDQILNDGSDTNRLIENAHANATNKHVKAFLLKALREKNENEKRRLLENAAASVENKTARAFIRKARISLR